MKTNKEKIGIFTGYLMSAVFIIFGFLTFNHFGLAFPDTDKLLAYLAISFLGFCLGALIAFTSAIYGRQGEQKIILDLMDEYIEDDIKKREKGGKTK